MMARRGKLKPFFFATLLTLALFAVIEVALRATLFRCGLPEPNLCTFGTVSYRFNDGPGGGDLVPNQDGVWAIWPHRPYHVQTNADGLRNAKEVDPLAELTILAVGDSFTFGPYVPNEDTWPAWLEFTLAQRAPRGRSLQVLNAGVAGYTIQDEYYYLAERGLSLKPDLVIIAFYPNDVSDFRGLQRDFLARGETTIRAPSLLSLLRKLFNRHESKLAILRLATRIKRDAEVTEVREGSAAAKTEDEGNQCDPFVASTSAESDTCWARFEDWLKRTTSLLERAEVPMLIVAIPDQRQLDGDVSDILPQSFVAAIASREGVAFLDLLPSLKEVTRSEALYLQRRDPVSAEYLGNAHMSAEGYRRVARRIAEEIEDRNLLVRR